LNQSAFILDVPGSGKSFNAKEQITFLMLSTEDDMICDPEGEFVPLVEAMGKEMGTVIHMTAGGGGRLQYPLFPCAERNHRPGVFRGMRCAGA
jgi:hypothetical protein